MVYYIRIVSIYELCCHIRLDYIRLVKIKFKKVKGECDVINPFFSPKKTCPLRLRASLTVRVLLVPVGHQSAVVPVIRDTVVVVVMVAGVPFAVLVVVGLVAVGDVRTVVQRVLVAVLVDIIVVVTHVPHQVAVGVQLQTRTYFKVWFFSPCSWRTHSVCL